MNPQGDAKQYIVSAEDVKALLRAHDGDCALLWLWQAATGSCDAERAALDLCMTASQVGAAREKLQRMCTLHGVPAKAEQSAGRAAEAPEAQAAARITVPQESAVSPAPPQEGFIPTAPQKFFSPARVQEAPAFTGTQEGSSSSPADRPPMPPADELPEYTAEDITSCAEKDAGFRAVLQEAEQITGKQLSRHDMSRMLGIYDHLGLGAEVIFILLHFCADSSAGPDGSERRPTMNYIERQAYAWVRHGISTAEDAENFAEREKAVREDLTRIKRLLEIYDRNLTGNERASIETWLSAGFSDEVIRKAYELTVENTGKRSMAYMNTILHSWAEAGVKTVSDIETKAGRKVAGTRKNSGAKPSGEPRLKPTEF